jgi:hypothetical protein
MVTLDTVSAADFLREQLDGYGEGFSVSFHHQPAGVYRNQKDAPLGRWELQPERYVLDLSFCLNASADPQRRRAEMHVEEASVERVVETAMATVRALLKEPS